VESEISKKIVLGGSDGRFEILAFDVHNPRVPRFFVTEAYDRGTLQRFTPSSSPNWTNPLHMLHDNGTI